MMYWGNHMGTGSWVFSIFGTLVILGLFAGALAWLIRDRASRTTSGGTPTASGESAREILDRRLVNGELTLEQYNQLHATLTDTQYTAPDPPPSRPASATG